MERITFGIDSPKELLEKLRFDGTQLKEESHPYDVFNFFITASVLFEWVLKHYPKNSTVKSIESAAKDKDGLSMPDFVREWIIDNSCSPNPAIDRRLDIVSVLRACNFTANSSKHYHWFKNNPVTDISTEPEVKNWYQYFFTSCDPGLYLEIDGYYYNLKQIEGILLQFYTGLLSYLEGGLEKKGAD